MYLYLFDTPQYTLKVSPNANDQLLSSSVRMSRRPRALIVQKYHKRQRTLDRWLRHLAQALLLRPAASGIIPVYISYEIRCTGCQLVLPEPTYGAPLTVSTWRDARPLSNLAADRLFSPGCLLYCPDGLFPWNCIEVTPVNKAWRHDFFACHEFSARIPFHRWQGLLSSVPVNDLCKCTSIPMYIRALG